MDFIRSFTKGFIALTFTLFVLQATATTTDDSLYSKRMAKLPNPMGISYKHQASKYIRSFISNPANTAKALGRYVYYKPLIDSILTRYGLPQELGLLTLGVSGTDCLFGDDNGNSGPWAMQYNTARMFDLKMNTYVDERRDMQTATEAAAKYLKELKIIYNDWGLALAAFASSTSTVNKTIRMAGNRFSFWEVYDSLPPEAQPIVPQFLAAMYINGYHAQHNISPAKFQLPASDSIVVRKWMSFEVLAPALHVSINELQLLNPKFKKNIVPYTVNGYVLYLPLAAKPYYGSVDGLNFEPYNTNPYMDETPELENKNIPIKKAPGSDSTSSDSLNVNAPPAPNAPGDTIIHVVSRGEGLGIIAQKYGVTVDDIKKWNDLKGYTIYPNQKLIIVAKKE